jgi:hypothetical protein
LIAAICVLSFFGVIMVVIVTYMGGMYYSMHRPRRPTLYQGLDDDILPSITTNPVQV